LEKILDDEVLMVRFGFASLHVCVAISNRNMKQYESEYGTDELFIIETTFVVFILAELLEYHFSCDYINFFVQEVFL
jgi:hypothetical protein